MRFRKILALSGGVAALACVTVAVAAEQSHVLTVRLPDGSIEHVRYTGDTPPRLLVVNPAAPPEAAFDPFADLARMSAMMDTQADQMMAQASEMQRVAMTQAGGAGAPQGAGSFTSVSTSTVNGKTCTVSVQSQPGKPGAAPQMIRKVSGDGCSAVQQQTGPHPVAQPATPVPPVAPHVVSVPATPRTVAPDTI